MEGYRLSPQQRDFVEAFGPGVETESCCCLRIKNVSDIERLIQAICDLVSSEEILRTHYPEVSGVRMQVIRDSGKWAAGITDLSECHPKEQAARIAAFQFGSIESPTTTPIGDTEAHIFQLSQDECVVMIRSNALSLDAKSHVILARRIAQSLHAKRSGLVDKPENETLQYADLAEWLNSLVDDPEGEDEQRFWRARIAAYLGDPDVLLAAEQRKSPQFQPEMISLDIDEKQHAAVREAAQSLSLDSHDVVLAAWSTLLWRLNSSESCSIFVESDGRNYEEIADSLGRFSKPLPINVECSGRQTFAEFSRQLRTQREDLERKQEYLSWGELVGTERSQLGDDLLQVGFAHIDVSVHEGTGDETVVVKDINSHTVPFLLKLETMTCDLRIRIRIWYDASRTTESVVDRLANRYKVLLAAVLENPDNLVSSFPVVDQDDFVAIEENFRGGALEVEPSCIVDAFLDSVARTPEEPAVSCDEITLTYSELDRRSTEVARLLRSKNIGQGSLVGILMPRSVDYLVGILAVLKSGAAYVPMDPEYPQERVRFVLADSQAAAVLITAELADSLEDIQTNIICIENLNELSDGNEEFVLPSTYPQDALAYVLYTSGSTGKPKGVMITRANLAYSTSTRLTVYGQSSIRFLLLSPFPFDSSVAGIFWTLSCSGHLVISTGQTGLNVDAIEQNIVRHKITHTLMLPSLYSLILDVLPVERLRSLECVIVAGESCTVSIVKKHFGKCIAADLYNEYGPTECTVWSTVYQCSDTDSSTQVPIGRAIPGATVMVLSPAHRPMPIGYSGEICIAGPGVTEGYWQQHDLSLDRFISVSTHRGDLRVYRTGDLAKLRCDGNIDFLGRKDFQVKINGYRIELEEVESAIQAFDEVKDVIVIAQPNGDGVFQLAAYLTLQDGHEIIDIQSQLGKRIPDFMIPSIVSVVDELPRLANGKVDRRALEGVPAVPTRLEYMPPRDNLERLFVEIWEEILRKDSVGVADNFFRLGGHSILATRVIAQIRDILQASVPIRLLFDNPTIAAFTDALRNEPSMKESVSAIESALEKVAALTDTHNKSVHTIEK